MRIIYTLYIFVSALYVMSAQCGDPAPLPGNFCDTNHPTSPAPIICSIECLDGYIGSMPDALVLPQPEPLCATGGDANNVSWFAFVAGNETIELTITPSGCTITEDENGINDIGIQAGIYTDCSFANSLICATEGCNDLVAQPLSLYSEEFIVGETYHLFVDGCSGSVCDYEVSVIQGKEQFVMPEITTISNSGGIDLEINPLCEGAEISFYLDNIDSIYDAEWTISPSTIDYPDGIHPTIKGDSATFLFSEAGEFEISVYVYNDCDASDVKSFSVNVEETQDEIFSDIDVCQECLPIDLFDLESGCVNTASGVQPSIFVEDPNGDGIVGWLGENTINEGGLHSFIVSDPMGCSYTQYVQVNEMKLSPREEVVSYHCLQDFPITIEGNTIGSPGEFKNVTLPGMASSGCDSLVRYTAHAIDMIGSYQIGECQSGLVEVAFDITSMSPANGEVSYTWYDNDGDVVIDGDAVDSILTVTIPGNYSVLVEVSYEGSMCAQNFGSVMVDVSNLTPDVPEISYSPISLCTNDEFALIYMKNQNLGEQYEWSLSPALPYTMGLTSDTIYVDISGGEDFEYCVFASNGCGASEDTCAMVKVTTVLDPSFDLPAVICKDSIVMVEYNQEIPEGAVFNWDFDGATIQNGASSEGPGPFALSFGVVKEYTVSLNIENGECTSSVAEETITITSPFIAPEINCDPRLGAVVFYWDHQDQVGEYDFQILTNQNTYAIYPDSLVVYSLAPDEKVEIEIAFLVGNDCGITKAGANCISESCPELDLQFELSAQSICENDDVNFVEVNGLLNGNPLSEVEIISPYAVGSQFDVSASGAGEFVIEMDYSIEGCTYSKDTTLTVYEAPIFDYIVTTPLCEAEGKSQLQIEGNDNYTIDGINVAAYTPLEMEIGSHEVVAQSIEGCAISEIVEIEDFPQLFVPEIEGDESIFIGESSSYTINDNLFDDEIYYWTINDEVDCVQCDVISVTPDEDVDICFIVEYSELCEASSCVEVRTELKTELYIPNIFSPNGDQINDYFIINSNNPNIKISSIDVFDRWGAHVAALRDFDISENSMQWDGRYSGNYCMPGVYVYTIHFTDEEGTVHKVVGDLTILP